MVGFRGWLGCWWLVAGLGACASKDDGDPGNASTGSASSEGSGSDTMIDEPGNPSEPADTTASATTTAGDESGEPGPVACAAEGESCQQGCCDALMCDLNAMTCSSTCLPFDAPCEKDSDCCDAVCPPDIGTCVGLG